MSTGVAFMEVAIALGLPMGVVVVVFLLNRRDVREAALLAAVAALLQDREMRNAVAVRVQYELLRARGRVSLHLDLQLGGTHHVWRVVECVDGRLPMGVALSITATSGGRSDLTITLRGRLGRAPGAVAWAP